MKDGDVRASSEDWKYYRDLHHTGCRERWPVRSRIPSAEAGQGASPPVFTAATTAFLSEKRVSALYAFGEISKIGNK